MLSDPPIGQEAQYVLPIYPVYVKPEWLQACVADYGPEAPTVAWKQVIAWMEGHSAGLNEQSRNSHIAGHSPMQVVQHIKVCWDAE